MALTEHFILDLARTDEFERTKRLRVGTVPHRLLRTLTAQLGATIDLKALAQIIFCQPAPLSIVLKTELSEAA